MSICAPALFALKVQLKSEAKPVDVTPVKLEGAQVTVRRAGREVVHALDDFVASSAFDLKKHFTPKEGRPRLELARFALRRELLAECRAELAEATRLDGSLSGDAQAVLEIADALETEAMLVEAARLLDDAKVEDARKLLVTLIERFPSGHCVPRAEAMLQTLDEVALQNQARKLAEEARKAQEAKDAEVREKRRASDDYLFSLETQLGRDEQALAEGDALATKGQYNDGLDKIDKAVVATRKLRADLKKDLPRLVYPGQQEHAGRIDDRAKKLLVNCAERWATHLFNLRSYALATKICDDGLELDPKDRRLLALKLDIDEVYDKKYASDGIIKPGGG